MPSSQYTQTEAVPQIDESESLDLRHYWSVLLRRRWLILPVFVAAVVGTLVYTLRQPKIYASMCTIIIELAPPRVLDSQQVQDIVESGSSSWWGRDYYETQFKILASRAVATRVADRLGLAANLKFLGLEGVSDAAERERRRQSIDVVALVQARLRIEPIKDSRVVRLVVEDPDPELAAAIANGFAEAYVGETLEVRSSTTQNASDWLEQRLADLEQKLEKSSRSLFDFKKEKDILAASWEDRQSMVTQRLTAINDTLTKARVQRAQLQARGEAIEEALRNVDKGDGDLESLPVVASNSAIQVLKQKYFETRTECADLKVKYLEKHPSYQTCLEKLNVTRANLREQMQTALRAAVREYQETRLNERNLLALFNETKADALGLNQYEREYLELRRVHENNQRLYDLVLKRLKDAGLSGTLRMSNVRILDRARPSWVPVRPKVQQNLLAAVLLGLLGGVALALAVEYLDNTIRDQEHVERLGLTFLGVIPRVTPGADGRAPDLVVHEQPKSMVAECCRSIRTNLLFMSPDRPLKTLLVTSAGPQEGKTTTAIDLAIAMADSGNRVLLLDADMRRPRVHKAFGLPNGAGLTSLVLGEARLADMVRSTPVPNLSALACGPIPPNPAELLHTSNFSALLQEMAGQFDRVVIDSPPVGAVSDALIMSTQVSGTLLVIKAGRTSREAARRAVHQLADVKARILGAVLNDLDTESSRYGGYYYAYGYYYGEKRQEPAS